jgi:hypothetical protein
MFCIIKAVPPNIIEHDETEGPLLQKQKNIMNS